VTVRPLILSVVVLASPAASAAQSVDELVQKNLQARGGADRLRAVTTVKMTGRAAAQGEESPIVIYLKRPNLVRQERTVQNRTLVMAFDGERAWAINPLAGSSEPQEITGGPATLLKESADFAGVLVDYKAKGVEIETAGSDAVDGRRVQVLKVVRDSRTSYIALDAETGLEARVSMSLDQGGVPVRIETRLSDYRTVGGIAMPFAIQSLVNGVTQVTVTFDDIQIDAPLDEGVFKMKK
jgi:outer membrane lipoprotein-sorting protein